jgi:hypothetical protein
MAICMYIRRWVHKCKFANMLQARGEEGKGPNEVEGGTKMEISPFGPLAHCTLDITFVLRTGCYRLVGGEE